MPFTTRETVTEALPEPKGRFAVLVGVAEFQSGTHGLKLTRADVEALADVLERSKSFDQVTALVDAQATKVRILQTIHDVRVGTGPGELLFVYFATHGARRNNASYLVAYDSILNGGPDQVPSFISTAELLAALPPFKTILIVTDSCNQDGAWQEEGFSFPSSLSENIAGLQSSRPTEVSREDYQLGHGVFSHYLIEGIRGDANRGPQNNNEISLFDLHRYITRKVRDYTGGTQNPILTYRGHDDFLVCRHPPTVAQVASIDRAQRAQELISEIELYWKAQDWIKVLDRWDRLLDLAQENHTRSLSMMLDAREMRDASIPAKYETEAPGLLAGYPRVWPCIEDRDAFRPEARRTHPDAAKEDLLVRVRIVEGKIVVASEIHVAKTNSFPAMLIPRREPGTIAPGHALPSKQTYVLAEGKFDMGERFVDLQADATLSGAVAWRALVEDPSALSKLPGDLRSMNLWTPLRRLILRRHPGEVTHLFQLELQPLRKIAAGGAQPSVLRELRSVGEGLIEEYLSIADDKDRAERHTVLDNLLRTYLEIDASRAEVKTTSGRRRRKTAAGRNDGPAEVRPAPGGPDRPAVAAGAPRRSRRDPAPPAPGSVATRGPAPIPSPAPGSASHGSVAMSFEVPSPDDRARRETPEPPAAAAGTVAPTDLRLIIRNDVRSLRAGEVVLWELPGQPLDWDRRHFRDGGAPPTELTLAEVKRKLPDWDRDDTERFGRQLCALLFGLETPKAVVDALTVDPAHCRRLVLDLDDNAGEAPWEYLYLNTGFLLERRLSVVRHVDAQATRGAHPLILSPPPRTIVFAYADPDAQTPEMQAHRMRIEEGLSGIAIRPVGSSTPNRIFRELSDNRGVDGFRFLGHGERDASGLPFLLVHADDRGGAQTRLFADKLASWLGTSTVRFVFLGACHGGDVAPGFSGIAQAIVRFSGIPVVAMQLDVPREFSTNFAANFYRRLKACGYDLERAVYEARQSAYEERHAFGLPVLFADVVKQARPVPELPAPPGERWAKFTLAFPPTPPRRPDSEPRSSVPLPMDGGTVTPADDDELKLDWDAARREFSKLRDRYALADHLLPRIASELLAGRHVVLTGPVGTGKTSIACELVEALGYKAHLVTASAEWTTFDVVGGFFPHALKDGDAHRIDYAFRFGVFLEAVRANWEGRLPRSNEPCYWHRKRTPEVRGTWLVLDEINRADIDRALGAVFTALERSWLRIPIASTQPGSPTTVEIPIPKDFRIMATMNGVDRHYLFRLSDALKRRFAFIEVPVPNQLGDEWQKVCQRCDVADASDAERTLYDEVRRFTYLVRAFHPVGTAQLLAAIRFLDKSRKAGLPPEVRLYQALAGSILPGLEDAPRDLLGLLHSWTETREPGKLAAGLKKMPGLHDAAGAHDLPPPQASVRIRHMLPHLEGLGLRAPPATDPPWDGDSADRVFLAFACQVARQHDLDLHLLREHVSAMVGT